MIHLTPALIVRADTIISECVKLMKKHDVGSVLVVSDDTKSDLVGIFTERDLLNRIELIEEGGHWQRNIRTVMTSPVRTLDISALEQAPKLMLKYGFRHLPIVFYGPDGAQTIAGIVSMRDLFKAQIENAGADKNSADYSKTMAARTSKKRISLGLISQDVGFLGMLKRLPESFLVRALGQVRPSERELLQQELLKMNILILDIDGMDKSTWPAVLKWLNKETAAPFAVVVFSPALHPTSAVKMLRQLSSSAKFGTFAKPVNVVELTNCLGIGGNQWLPQARLKK